MDVENRFFVKGSAGGLHRTPKTDGKSFCQDRLKAIVRLTAEDKDIERWLREGRIAAPLLVIPTIGQDLN